MSKTYELKDEAGEVKYNLQFTHIHDSRNPYVSQTKLNLFLIRGAVSCYVYRADGSYLGSGASYCFHKDKFDARKGERLALKEALDRYNDKLQREARRFIWTEYFKLRPIKPKPDGRQIRKAKVQAALRKIEPRPSLREILAELTRQVADMKKMLEHPLHEVKTGTEALALDEVEVKLQPLTNKENN